MGGTTSKESPPGGSESRGGVKPGTTKSSAAESEADKYDSTSTTVVAVDVSRRQGRLHAGLTLHEWRRAPRFLPRHRRPGVSHDARRHVRQAAVELERDRECDGEREVARLDAAARQPGAAENV